MRCFHLTPSSDLRPGSQSWIEMSGQAAKDFIPASRLAPLPFGSGSGSFSCYFHQARSELRPEAEDDRPAGLHESFFFFVQG